MNVSVLAMALAEYIGLGPREVRAFGISGLMHDLGKVTIPEDILNKPGKLTDDERAVMNNHTIAGARIIIETEQHLELAAVVAYEHHIKIDGGGYPSLRFPRPCQQASNLVHVCDVFDALRTDRPYRGAWETERVLGLLDEGSGTEFDADLAQSFVRMMRQWEGQIAVVERETRPFPSVRHPGLRRMLRRRRDPPTPQPPLRAKARSRSLAASSVATFLQNTKRTRERPASGSE